MRLSLTGLFVLGVALMGGWFGCRLFPPVVSTRQRGLMSSR